MTVYLADTSIWSWADKGHRPDIATALYERIDRDELATCHPVVVEYLHRARTSLEVENLVAHTFEPLQWLPSGSRVWKRALEVQRSLAGAAEARHRRPAMDYVVAATAELSGPDVVLWAFDRDLRVICEHTGQPHELESDDPDESSARPRNP
mgnify:CR=1 FL=1